MTYKIIKAKPEDMDKIYSYLSGKFDDGADISVTSECGYRDAGTSPEGLVLYEPTTEVVVRASSNPHPYDFVVVMSSDQHASPEALDLVREAVEKWKNLYEY